MDVARVDSSVAIMSADACDVLEIFQRSLLSWPLVTDSEYIALLVPPEEFVHCVQQ